MQNVVAIPFVVPPQAAGAVVPSTDGAFQLSFASEAPDRPEAGEAAMNTAGLWGAPTMPFALVPQAPHPQENAPAAELAEAGQGQNSLMSDAADAKAQNAPVLGPVGLDWADESVKNGPDDHPEAEGPRPVMQNPAIVFGGDGGFPVPSPAPAARTAIVGTAGTILASSRGRAADALTPVPTMPRASGAGLVDGQGALGLAAGALSSANAAGRYGRLAEIPSAPAATGIAVRVSGSPVPPTNTASTEAAPTVSGTSGAASEPPLLDGDLHQALNTGETGTAKASAPVGHSIPATPDPVDRGAEIGLSAVGALAASEHLVDQAFSVRWTTAPTTSLPGGAAADILTIGQAAEDANDLMSRPDTTDAAMQDPLPAPQRDVTSVVAGFWERLLTGLSQPGAGDPSAGAFVDLPGAGAGRRDAPEGDQLSTPATVMKPVTPAAIVAAASSHAVFARGQAQLAAPSPDLGRESDVAEPSLAALSLPGALPPGLSLPQTASSAPVQLPVPHVAAQITAALSHSADGATELALSPEELGRVRLRLERDANNPDRMVVHVTFERPETLDLFRRHADELAEALRDAGYAGADIGFGQQDSSADTPHREGPSSGADYASPGAGQAEARSPESSALRRMAGASLDLRL